MMTRMPARYLLVAAGLVIPVAMSAQGPHEIADGFRDPIVAPWSDLTGRCATAVRNPYVFPITRSVCRVVNLTPLGSVGGSEWSVVRYLREVIVTDTAVADTMPIDEFVLLSRARGADTGRAVWHLMRERTYEFLDTLKWTPTPVGVFLELRVCLNGTGGCHTEYLRFAGDHWRAVGQPFTRELRAQLPADHWLHKGRRLDLGTLTGVWPVSAPGDANCCPSLELPFRLLLDGDSLRLVDGGPLRRASDPPP
jgi:hypothetical protein